MAAPFRRPPATAASSPQADSPSLEGALSMALLHYNRIPAKAAAVAAAVGSVLSMDKRKGSSCQHNDDDDDDDTQDAKIMGCSFPDLPEDIWFSIHSLMPMREAARVACLSHAFLRSWQCRPNLIFNSDTVGMDPNGSMYGWDFSRKVDRIISKHSGTGVKIFRLDYFGLFEYNASCYLERWLQVAVKPGIEEVTLMLSKTEREYNFPCSLLSDGIGSSIRHLKLRFCALRPTAELGPLRNLTTLQLSFVSITGDELESLLYNSLALEQLDITNCREMICLKMPCSLQQLSRLNVFGCERLKMIESKAPNLSSFGFRGCTVKLSLGETLKIKKLYMDRDTMVSSARTELPLHMPNLETLVISSSHEVANTPMLPSKFLYLKHLNIDFVSGSIPLPSYDYFSLVSFLDSSPSLETFTLNTLADEQFMEQESMFLNPSDLRQMPEHRHGRLKSVKISCFRAAKGLVELTCYILKNAVSLECITLDITYYRDENCELKTGGLCISYTPDSVLSEVPRTLSVIRTYIEDKVPPSVKLTVVEPCRCCYIRGSYL